MADHEADMRRRLREAHDEIGHLQQTIRGLEQALAAACGIVREQAETKRRERVESMSKPMKCAFCNGEGELEFGPDDPEATGGSWWTESSCACPHCGGSGDEPGQFEIGAALRDKREGKS